MTIINSNISALKAHNGSRLAEKSLRTSLERLSTGQRINSARDDAAGLSISSSMSAYLKGMAQAIRNTNDGISLAQTADSAFGEVGNMLQRVRELAIQSASASYSASDRTNLKAEADQLNQQIGQIRDSTKFNGMALFSTSDLTFDIQTGINAGDSTTITINKVDLINTAITTVDLSTAAGASAALTPLDDAIKEVNTTRARIGAAQKSLEASGDALTTNVINLSDARSRIADADFSSESTGLVRAQILSQASTAMLAQANQTQQGVIALLR